MAYYIRKKDTKKEAYRIDIKFGNKSFSKTWKPSPDMLPSKVKKEVEKFLKCKDTKSFSIHKILTIIGTVITGTVIGTGRPRHYAIPADITLKGSHTPILRCGFSFIPIACIIINFLGKHKVMSPRQEFYRFSNR